MEEDMGTLGEGEKIYVMGDQGGPLLVHVKKGEIVRVRPLPLKEEDVRKGRWKIEARGKVFESPLRAGIPPFSLSCRRRVHSPLRLQYPMKRAGFEPGGKSGIENRGRGEFVRISWDEALDILINELKRIKETYGNSAIFTIASGHGNMAHLNSHGLMRRVLNLWGGNTPMIRNPDSWEGWYWGGEHAWGFDETCGTGSFYA